ncbi:hypothetical protein [Amycolatopsis thermoflava]|uniref:hypothetical protein n=1 Tax=Amycolatopsis thermoflava TaxID=84480 RepID=UPI0004829D2A|nr:hypothetical protein [Amycolatopsis thermoflava]
MTKVIVPDNPDRPPPRHGEDRHLTKPTIPFSVLWRRERGDAPIQPMTHRRWRVGFPAVRTPQGLREYIDPRTDDNLAPADPGEVSVSSNPFAPSPTDPPYSVGVVYQLPAALVAAVLSMVAWLGVAA